MANPRGDLIWYELMTTDIAAAKVFYDAVVGWDVDPTVVAPGTDYHMIRRADGGIAGGVLPLSAAMQNGGARPTWITYIHVPDVDTTAAAIVTDGGTELMAAWDQPGVGRLAMVTGPEGAAFYLMNPTRPADRPDAQSDVFSVDKAQHFRWNELWSGDPSRSVDFYQRHFGWVQDGEMDMEEMGKYQFLQHGGVMIGAVMPRMPDTPVSMWNFYIGVDDIDRAVEAVRAHGGTIVQEPIEIPGGEYSINATDPAGAIIGFVGPRH